jgi:sugar lactone lactonase YvrE|mmetsp:Transcript_11836/g.19431  ORF Transcript_11836/g.19431 Transcript_11836/m.19431 type:complete len:369 (-) Transcript_11836:132-1238(-)|eukprot:CAMPEP_0169119430 /NCGR_PEP_ID=MMETSP1015-20121227/31552_1 /TAXON_ID=342587 /ORGANISM="Karlodinium micrum, Strain CCMP2283" /LENGTH=368 /DNA_ID=CAMNT_0009182309 /DNA_START=51 /DNA_END=1157 /DNA_ORIENTATION=-
MAPTGEIDFLQYGTGVKSSGFDEEGRKRLKQPRGISVDADGSLLVADWGNHCVVKFDGDDPRGSVVAGQDGKMLPTVDPLKDIDRPLGPAEGEGELMKRPVDACWDQNGGLLVLDTEACRIQRFPKDGRAETVVPSPNGPPQRSVNGPEAIKYPRSLVQLPGGDIVICDTWSHRVLRYGADDSAPVLLAGLPNSAGTSPEHLNFPSGIAFDDQGRLFVADTNNHRIQCFLPGQTSGTTVAGSVSCVEGSGLGELNMPTGICIDPRDNSLLVADRMNSRLLRFPAGGGQQGEEIIGAQQELSRPWGVCQGKDGTIYVSDERAAVVLRVDAPAPLAYSKQPLTPEPAIDVGKAAVTGETLNASQDATQLD